MKFELVITPEEEEIILHTESPKEELILGLLSPTEADNMFGRSVREQVKAEITLFWEVHPSRQRIGKISIKRIKDRERL